MEYQIVRSKRKTLSVSVRDGRVIVRAPMRLDLRTIEEFVQKHAVWIARRLAEQREMPRLDLRDGGTVSLCGRERRIQTGRTRLTDDVLFLPEEGRSQALLRLLKNLTRVRMTALTEEIAARFGFSYQKIAVSSARTRWGSCSANGTISYTFRSAFLPDELAFYLAAHELCHTRHMNHGPSFWALLESIVPACKAKRKRLKSYEWAMKCL